MSKTIMTSKFSQAYAKVENKNSYIRSLIDNLIDSGKYSLDDVFDIIKDLTDSNFPERESILDTNMSIPLFPKIPNYVLVIYNISYYSSSDAFETSGCAYSVVKRGEAITDLPNLSGDPNSPTKWYTDSTRQTEYTNTAINSENTFQLYCKVVKPAPPASSSSSPVKVKINYGFFLYDQIGFVFKYYNDIVSGAIELDPDTNSIILNLDSNATTINKATLDKYKVSRPGYDFYSWTYFNTENETIEIADSTGDITIANISDATVYANYTTIFVDEDVLPDSRPVPGATDSVNIGDLRDYLHNLIGRAIIPSLDIYERYYFTIDDYILKSNVSYDKESNKIQNILQANEEYAEGVQDAKVMTGTPVVTSALGEVIFESMYANASKINNTFSNTRALLDAPFLYDTSKPGLFFRDSRNNLLYGFLNNSLNIFTAQKYNSFLNLLESTSETVLEELNNTARDNVKSKISEDWGDLGSSIIDYKSIFDSEFNYLPNMGDAIAELSSAIKDYMYYVVLRFEIIPPSYLLYETCKKLIIEYGDKIKTNSNTIQSVEISSIEEIYTIETLYLITNFICDAIPSVDTNKYISTSFEDDINKIEECSGKFELLLTKVYGDVPVIRTHYKNIIEKILINRTEHFNLSDAVKDKFSINTDTN